MAGAGQASAPRRLLDGGVGARRRPVRATAQARTRFRRGERRTRRGERRRASGGGTSMAGAVRGLGALAASSAEPGRISARRSGGRRIAAQYGGSRGGADNDVVSLPVRATGDGGCSDCRCAARRRRWRCDSAEGTRLASGARERVPYQMPAASSRAAIPATNASAGVRRELWPMTTGAIARATAGAFGSGTGASIVAPCRTTKRSSASRERSRASLTGSSWCFCASSSTAEASCSSVSTRRCPSESPSAGSVSSASPAAVRAHRVGGVEDHCIY